MPPMTLLALDRPLVLAAVLFTALGPLMALSAYWYDDLLAGSIWRARIAFFACNLWAYVAIAGMVSVVWEFGGDVGAAITAITALGVILMRRGVPSRSVFARSAEIAAAPPSRMTGSTRVREQADVLSRPDGRRSARRYRHARRHGGDV